MKILHVITSMLSGGAEKLLTELLPLFCEYGIEVELAVFNAIDTPLLRDIMNKGIRTHRFAERGCGMYSISNYLKLNKLISNNHYDIVHTHNTPCQLLLSLCRKPKGTKYITTEHNTCNRRREIGFLKYTDRYMYSTYDKVICVSEPVKTNLFNFIGNTISKKCEVIPNGINLNDFEMPFRLMRDTNKTIITMVASFRPQKDHFTLMKSIATLPDKYYLRLVGEGETEKEIRLFAQKLGITHRTEFTGQITDIPSILADSDILVLSSNYEGLSLSCLECMASGRPFIASDVPGLREIVDGYGILFKRGNYNELSNEIQKLANDRIWYEKTVRRCQRRAKEFDIKVTGQKYMETYNSLYNV